MESGEEACDGFTVASMDLTVRPTHDKLFLLSTEGFAMRCAVGRGGLKADKREGDGATPIGRWPIREGYYRPDRLPRPDTRLKMTALTPDDGWCDAAGDPHYNRLVQLPYAGSHEAMWRRDDIYDVVLAVGYNDDPVVAGKGSAIFLHVARPAYSPTAGCVAVSLEDMMKLLALIEPDTHLVVMDC